MPHTRAPGVDAGGTRSSASTIAVYMDTGSHELTVSGYPSTTGLGVGKFKRSAPFIVGRHRWFIRYYPDGDREESADSISVYLELDDTQRSNNAEVIAEFRFDLLDQTGEPVAAYTRTSNKVDFSVVPKRCWGYRDFIRRKELEQSSLIEDDTFRITCHVTVINIRTESSPVRFPAAPPPSMDLNRDLGALLETSLGTDVEFKVRRKTFAAHRNVLAARSPVFKAELFGWMKEKKAAKIKIQDMEPRVFAAMLHFVYTDSFPPIDDADTRVMAQHLLVAADRYRLEGMKTICEDVLRKCIDTDTVAATLVLAEQHACPRLKDGCFNFLKYPGNVKAVMATDGFNHLMSSFPSLLKELLAKVSP